MDGWIDVGDESFKSGLELYLANSEGYQVREVIVNGNLSQKQVHNEPGVYTGITILQITNLFK